MPNSYEPIDSLYNSLFAFRVGKEMFKDNPSDKYKLGELELSKAGTVLGGVSLLGSLSSWNERNQRQNITNRIKQNSYDNDYVNVPTDRGAYGSQNIDMFNNSSFKDGGEFLQKEIDRLGYKRNSPFVNRPFNDIRSNNITMSNVDKILKGIADTGEEKIMYPGNDYHFKGASVVREIPLYQSGGNIQTLGNIKFDSNKAIQHPNGFLVVKDINTGKDYSVLRNDNGSYDWHNGTPLKSGLLKNNQNETFNPINKFIISSVGNAKGLPTTGFSTADSVLNELSKYSRNRPNNTMSNEEKNLREKIYTKIDPVSYYDVSRKINNFNNPNLIKPKSETGELRNDYWKQYLGLDETLKKSPYREGTYLPSDPNARKALVDDYLHRNGLGNRVLGKSRNNFTSISNTKALEPLGQFITGRGIDNDGDYLSMYDKWDIDPLDEYPRISKIAPNINNLMNPFEVYDRVYLKDLPKSTQDSIYMFDKTNGIIPKDSRTQKQYQSGGYKIAQVPQENTYIKPIANQPTTESELRRLISYHSTNAPTVENSNLVDYYTQQLNNLKQTQTNYQKSLTSPTKIGSVIGNTLLDLIPGRIGKGINFAKISQDPQELIPFKDLIQYAGELGIIGNSSFKFQSGGEININPANKGVFTAKAERNGMTVQQFAHHVMSDKDNYSVGTRRQAQFAINSRRFKHQDGGEQESDIQEPQSQFEDWQVGYEGEQKVERASSIEDYLRDNPDDYEILSMYGSMFTEDPEVIVDPEIQYWEAQQDDYYNQQEQLQHSQLTQGTPQYQPKLVNPNAQSPEDIFPVVNQLKQMGYKPSSVNTGKHNESSLHYHNKALDLGINTTFGGDSKKMQNFIDNEFPKLQQQYPGLKLRDERTKPNGQKVWSGSHLHLELPK